MGRVSGVDARMAVGRADAIRTTVRRIEAIRTIVGGWTLLERPLAWWERR